MLLTRWIVGPVQVEAGAQVDTFWTKVFEEEYRQKLQTDIKVLKILLLLVELTAACRC